jgi:FkbM family methyltransferase
MFHRILLFIVLFFPTIGITNTSQILSTIRLPIYQATPDKQNAGYNNCDMTKNGELDVVNNFIKPDHVVFDIGANKGDWSAYVLKTIPGIALYAFEPIPDIFVILKKNIPSTNVAFFNIAVAEEDTTKAFFYYAKNSVLCELSTLHRRSDEVEQRFTMKPTVLSVPTKKIDSICKELGISHIDFMKIDTEGAELDVLHGARGLLERNAISILQFEYGGTYKDAQITLEEVYTFLTSHDYSIFRMIPNGLIQISEWNPTLESYQYSNYLAVANQNMKE